MNRIRTKICGITRVEDATAAQTAGADAIGLNFYQKSKRYVEPKLADRIAAAVRDQLAVVGVFVNSTLEEVCDIATQVGLSHIQLHGDEQPELLDRIRLKLSEVKFIRAIRIFNNDLQFAQSEIDRWQSAGVDLVLLDAASLGAFGGTGKQLDWNRLGELKFNVPWILAGGLTPQNVAESISPCRPSGVDVASGVESNPGIKGDELVREFVNAAMRALQA